MQLGKFKRGLAAALLIAAFLPLCGCAAILEGESLQIEEHIEQDSGSSGADTINFTEVSTYGELRGAVIQLIEERKENGIIRIGSYDGDINEDIDKVCLEVTSEVPLAAYAVFSMSRTVNRIVSYYDIELNITYKKTWKQMNSLSQISTLRYLKLEIQDMMKSYDDYRAYYTSFTGVAVEDITEYIAELYYENPLDIVVMPKAVINVYPDKGSERIIEIQLDYEKQKAQLDVMSSSLQAEVKSIAGAASGTSDGEILLSLCRGLMERAEYDHVAAGSGNFDMTDYVETAYGALVEGVAVGEGYAMAFKALCDEMGLECYVVLGSFGSIPHAWNIVALDGEFYHVDVCMCDENGEETAFLLNDEDMKRDYWWDTKLYKTCSGELKYFDIAG